MSDIQLKDKAITLKGKQYVQVKDRINYFNEVFENGSIRTELLSEPSSNHYVVKATIVPDVKSPERYFNGLSQAELGKQGANFEAALENAETSAIGRAMAMMGIGVIDSVASVDEMHKAGAYKATTATKEASNDEGYDATENALCRVHQNPDGSAVVMKHYENSEGEWWSHQTADGKWCNGRLAKYNGAK